MRYLANVVTLAYDPSKCTGCARCAEVCPHGVFVMSGPSPEGNRARLTDRDLCMECGACQANCRFGAIRVRQRRGLRLGHHRGGTAGNRADLRLLGLGRCSPAGRRVLQLADPGQAVDPGIGST